jgi:hypothetical protein
LCRNTGYVDMTECVCDTCHHVGGICSGFSLHFGMSHGDTISMLLRLRLDTCD